MKLIKILEDIQHSNLMIEEIKKYCKISWGNHLNNNYLYRGIRGSADKDVIKITPIERNAKDWSNIPNVLFDKQNEGKVQRRSNSIIFSTDKLDASSYGATYNIFPEDGAKVTYGTSDDNTNNFSKTLSPLIGKYQDIETFDRLMLGMISSPQLDNPKSTGFDSIFYVSPDYDKIMSALKETHREILKNKNIDFSNSFSHPDNDLRLKELVKYFQTIPENQFEQKILELFDADKNEIKTVDLGQIYSIQDNVECWTESVCYAIRSDYVIEAFWRHNDIINSQSRTGEI